jgi:hypothetical protein
MKAYRGLFLFDKALIILCSPFLKLFSLWRS